jgi:hypothetical protein
MMNIMLVQWAASLLGLLAATGGSYVFGHGSPGTTTLCILIVAGIVGRLFWKAHPAFRCSTFMKGSLIYFLSIVVLLFSLGRLDHSTALAIAIWYGQWRMGPSVGWLILQWAFVPLPFGMAALSHWLRKSQSA